MPLSDYCIERALQHCFGQSKPFPVMDFYIGLTSGELLTDGSNINMEFSGGGYIRRFYHRLPDFWSHPTSGEMFNIGYTEWRAASNWGIISGFFISDNLTIREDSGLIAMTLLDTPKVVHNGDRISLSLSGLAISLT